MTESTHINIDTESQSNTHATNKPKYHEFFEKHGVRVKDSELAEESVRMVEDKFSLFSMWRFVGSKDTLSDVSDIPRCYTSLDLEAVEPGPESTMTSEDLPDDILHKLETANTHSPVFTMAGYMARMQEARKTASFIKEHTGLDVYQKEDFQKMKHLLYTEQDPLLVNLLGKESSLQAGGLFITSNTFNSLQGSSEVPVTGAWFDGPLYPKELRDTWLEKGEYLGWERTPARLLDPKVMFGEKIGNTVAKWHEGNVLKTMAWDKTKIGGKLIGFGFGLWFLTILFAKRYQLQYRDHLTNQLIFAERMHSLEDYYPVTEASVHKQLQLRGYLQSYFEEEEEDEDEEL